MNPALFRVCANVPLVSVLSTFLFSSIFVESEYATFSMVRAPHANSAIKKALFPEKRGDAGFSFSRLEELCS